MVAVWRRHSLLQPSGDVADSTRKKLYQVGFIGTLYPQRARYLEKLVGTLIGTLRFAPATRPFRTWVGYGEGEHASPGRELQGIANLLLLTAGSKLLVEKIFECNGVRHDGDVPAAVW